MAELQTLSDEQVKDLYLNAAHRYGPGNTFLYALCTAICHASGEDWKLIRPYALHVIHKHPEIFFATV